MSRARSTDGIDQTIDLGETIAEELHASGLPLDPRQFAFAFAYKNRRNAALNVAADALKARNGALTRDDVEQLHDTYLSPWRLSGNPDEIAARLTAKLQELACALDGAMNSTQAQREAIAAETSELSTSGALTLHGVLTSIDRLAQSSRESQARYALLESRMETMGREIVALQSQLAAVRNECEADPTTALPGAVRFAMTLGALLAQKAVARRPIALMVCNLDYFSAFNERFGNFMGDQVLRSIGVLLKAHTRRGDMVARLRADTFGVILGDTTARDAVTCAERFRQGLMAHELVPHPNRAGRVTVSVGVAAAVPEDDADSLRRRAEGGLEVAKREGRNRVVEMRPEGPIWKAERRA